MPKPARASSAERKATSTPVMAFMAQPTLAPSQIRPARVPTMFCRARSTSASPPPPRRTRPAAMPMPAALAAPQMEDRVPRRWVVAVVSRQARARASSMRASAWLRWRPHRTRATETVMPLLPDPARDMTVRGSPDMRPSTPALTRRGTRSQGSASAAGTKPAGSSGTLCSAMARLRARPSRRRVRSASVRVPARVHSSARDMAPTWARMGSLASSWDCSAAGVWVTPLASRRTNRVCSRANTARPLPRSPVTVQSMQSSVRLASTSTCRTPAATRRPAASRVSGVMVPKISRPAEGSRSTAPRATAHSTPVRWPLLGMPTAWQFL